MARSTALNLGMIGTSSLLASLANQIVIIILAHFLDPSDFGIFAVCQVVLNLSISISGFGLEEAAIQTKKDSENSIATAASLRLVLAFAVALVVVITAPSVAAFFGVKEATSAIQVLSISFIILGLAFAPRVWLKRELRFGRLAVVSVTNTVLWSVSALTLGVLGFGYWALIGAFVIGALVSCIVVWFLRPTKVKLRLKKNEAKALFSFGGYMLATTIIVFVLLNVDKLAVGKLLGSDMLGVYWIAFLYGTQPTMFLTGVLTSVIFPEYVVLSGDISILREKHRKILRYLALASLPIGIGIAGVSPSFVEVLFGPEWSDAVVPLSILSVFGVLFSMTSGMGVIFMATANTRQMFKQNIVMLIPFVVLLVPVTQRWELVGISCLFVAEISVQLLWVVRSVGRILDCSLAKDLIGIYFAPFLASLTMAIGLISIWLVLGTSVVTLIVQIIAGSIIYASMLIVLTRGTIVSEVRGILENIRTQIRS